MSHPAAASPLSPRDPSRSICPILSRSHFQPTNPTEALDPAVPQRPRASLAGARQEHELPRPRPRAASSSRSSAAVPGRLWQSSRPAPSPPSPCSPDARVAAQPVISAAAEPQDSSAALLFISLPLPNLSPLPCSAPRRHRHGVRRWLPAAALLRRRIRRDPAPTARILPSSMGSASLLRRRHAKPSPSSRSARRSAAEHLPLPASSASSRMRRPLARSSSSVDRAPFSSSFDRVKTQAQPRQAPAGPRPTSPTGLASASVLFILGRASKAQGEPPPTPRPLSVFIRCWA